MTRTLPSPPRTPTHSSSQNQQQGDVILKKKKRACACTEQLSSSTGAGIMPNLNYFLAAEDNKSRANSAQQGAVWKLHVRVGFSISRSFQLEGQSQLHMEYKEHGSRQAALKSTGKETGKLARNSNCRHYYVQPLPSRGAGLPSVPGHQLKWAISSCKAGGKQASCGACAAHRSGPSSLAAKHSSSTHGVDCLRPLNRLSRRPVHTAVASPRKLQPSHPKEQPSLPKTHWEQSCQSSERAARGGQHFQQTHKGEQSTPRGSHQETKIRCYTRYQSKAVFTEHCFTKSQSTLTLKALSKPSYTQKYKSPNNVQAPCWTIKNLHPSLT